MQKLWKVTNSIERQPEPNWPLKIPTNADSGDNNSNNFRWTKSSAEKAEAFATYLEKRFTPIFTNTLEDRNQIENSTQQIIQQHYKQHQVKSTNQNNQQQCQQEAIADSIPKIAPFRPVRDNEVIKIIKTLKLKKSPGMDAIDNKVIKSLPKKAILYLVLINNSMLRLGHFPKQWKCAAIKMILKSGKKN